jgi:two-component system response regulator AtoC
MYELYSYVLNDEPSDKQELLFTVTLLDDDSLFREQMKDYLISMNITDIETFSSGEEFLENMKDNDRRFVVCDFDFGSPHLMNGLQVLDAIKKRSPDMPVLILSAQDKVSVAMQALRAGAVDYFIKGTENAFTSVMTSIIKINELQRLKKSQKDYQFAMIIGTVAAVLIIVFLIMRG